MPSKKKPPREAFAETPKPSAKKQEMCPIGPKLFRRFFEPVLLLHALDPVRGSREYWDIPEKTAKDLDPPELLHKFLSDISYICDTEQGGDTVTAAALGKDPETLKPVLVLACNEKMKDKTQEGLESVLEHMRKLPDDPTERELSDLEGVILSEIVDLASSRLKTYRRFAKTQLKPPVFGKEFVNSIGPEFKRLVKDIDEALNQKEMLDTVWGCYQLGRSPIMFRLLDSLAAEHRDNPFRKVSDLRHYVGRLGRHIPAAEIITLTALKHRELFSNGIRIHLIPPSAEDDGPLRASKCTPDSIIGRMYKGNQIDQQRKKLAAFNDKWNLDIPRSLQNSCKGLKTRVHAEMQLVDAFSDTGSWRFYDPTDMFIGCSKAACYLCYHYLKAFAPDMELRGTHQKIYFKWRPPDIPIDAHNCTARDRARTFAMNNMVMVVRNDVTKSLEKVDGPWPNHPDSSTGITNPYPAPIDPNIVRKYKENARNGNSKLSTMVLASASASEPSTTSVRPRSTTPVRPRSTTPVRPRSTTPVRPRSTTPVRPRSTTPVRPRSTTPMRPHRALLTIIDEDQSATSSKYSDEDSLNGPDTGYTTASSVQYASEDETTVVARSHYGPNDTLGQELPTQFAPGRSFMRPGNDNTSGAGASYAGSDFSRDATPQSDPDDELSEELPTQFAPGSLFMEPGNDNMSEAASFAGSDFFRDPRFVHSEPESGDEADELGGGVLAQLSPGRSFMRPDNDNISEAASYAGSDFSRDAMSQSDPDDTLIQELPTQFEPGSLFVEPDNDNMTEAESSYAGSDVFQDARLVFSNPDSDDEGGVKLQL